MDHRQNGRIFFELDDLDCHTIVVMCCAVLEECSWPVSTTSSFRLSAIGCAYTVSKKTH